MATTSLEDFIKEAHEQVDAFERMWRKNHAAEPDVYPMELDESNSGIWWEQLADFEDY